MRFSPNDDFDALLKMIQGWLDNVGDGCTLKIIQQNPKFPMTSTDDTDPWWKAFESACEKQ